jgi:hypothetical protein
VAADLVRAGAWKEDYTPNTNFYTILYYHQVLRDAFPGLEPGDIPVESILAALETEGSPVRDAALWTPEAAVAAAAAAADACEPGAPDLGVPVWYAGVEDGMEVRIWFEAE